MLIIFAATILGSELFTVGTLTLYSHANLSAGQVYAISPYIELTEIVTGLIIITAIMLILIRYGLMRIIFWIFIVISFLIILEFYDTALYLAFPSDYVSMAVLGLAVLTIVYYVKFAGTVGRNLVNIVIFITISSILSLSLGVLPTLILVGIIAVYDYIAVFVTKHMLTLAGALSKGGFLFSGIVLSAKKIKNLGRGHMILGGGDLVFPAMFVDAVYVNYPIFASYLVSVGALLGLGLIILLGKRGKAYPAMSVIGPAQILFFGLYILTTFIRL